jgi:hypothetical protein
MSSVAALQSGVGPQPAVQSAPADYHMSFRSVLSMLNPLQYLPVIGTIYRAITGDQIPEAVRSVGSLVVSTVLGGPIGAAINVALLVVQKITGIDLDKIGQKLLAGNAPAAHPADHPAPVTARGAVADSVTASASAPTPARATTPASAPASASPALSTAALRAAPDPGVSTAQGSAIGPASAVMPALAAAPAARTEALPIARAAALPTTPSWGQAWSPAQLVADGVDTNQDGVLTQGDRRGADVLNGLELLRIRGAQSAYGRAASLAA